MVDDAQSLPLPVSSVFGGQGGGCERHVVCRGCKTVMGQYWPHSRFAFLMSRGRAAKESVGLSYPALPPFDETSSHFLDPPSPNFLLTRFLFLYGHRRLLRPLPITRVLFCWILGLQPPGIREVEPLRVVDAHGASIAAATQRLLEIAWVAGKSLKQRSAADEPRPSSATVQGSSTCP